MKKREINSRDVRNVKLWLASFVLLAVAVVLSVFCFLLAHLMWLYIICGAVLGAFVILYCKTTNAITCLEGYTLIQAMWFYRACCKQGLEPNKKDESRMEQLRQLAEGYDFAKQLDSAQMLAMHDLGRRLTEKLSNKER